MQNQIEDHCEQPFWRDPMILFRHFTLEYRPTCSHSPFNFTARLVLLSLFVGIIGSLWGGLSLLMVGLVFGLLTAMMIIMTTPMNNEKRDRRDAQYSEDRNAQRSEKRSKRESDNWHTLPFQAVVNPHTHVKVHPHHEKQMSQQAQQQQQVTEHFVNGGADPRSVQPTASPIGMAAIDAFPYSGCPLPDHTPPTSRNPFMNILLDDIKYHPQRPAASPVDHPDVAQTMDDYFRIQWFSDPTDVFGKNQGQRQFITQPSTTVPNDQGSFADWLYKIPGKTCKEGGRAACKSGSDGGLLPWLSHSS